MQGYLQLALPFAGEMQLELPLDERSQVSPPSGDGVVFETPVGMVVPLGSETPLVLRPDLPGVPPRP